jgi:hypothetical protein
MKKVRIALVAAPAFPRSALMPHRRAKAASADEKQQPTTRGSTGGEAPALRRRSGEAAAAAGEAGEAAEGEEADEGEAPTEPRRATRRIRMVDPEACPKSTSIKRRRDIKEQVTPSSRSARSAYAGSSPAGRSERPVVRTPALAWG